MAGLHARSAERRLEQAIRRRRWRVRHVAFVDLTLRAHGLEGGNVAAARYSLQCACHGGLGSFVQSVVQGGGVSVIVGLQLPRRQGLKWDGG
jgi:hypothetical protein